MFVLRMAVRETRASLQRLFFFFVCIAVGVAAIVALRSVIQSARGVFGSEAKALIAADVLIATNRDWTADATTVSGAAISVALPWNLATISSRRFFGVPPCR